MVQGPRQRRRKSNEARARERLCIGVVGHDGCLVEAGNALLGGVAQMATFGH